MRRLSGRRRERGAAIVQQARIQEAAAEYRKEGGCWWCTGHRAVGREKKRGVCCLQQTDSPKPRPQATPMRAQCSAQTACTAARAPPQSRRGTLGAQASGHGVPPQPSPTCTCAQTKQGKARVSSAKTKRGRVGETARARGYLRPPTAGYFYITISGEDSARQPKPLWSRTVLPCQNRPIGLC